MTADDIYFGLLRDILENGERVSNRTGTDTLAVFGRQLRFDLSEGFPALTTKKLAWKGVVGELLWFLEGSDDERRLAEITFGRPRAELVDKPTIWTANADTQGVQLGYPNGPDAKKLGPIYGVQWRRWNAYKAGAPGSKETIDQLSLLIAKLKSNPEDRRLILTSWNVGDLSEMTLPPCHCTAQFRVLGGKLSCQMYQRSADTFLGVPFNIASYALLTHLIARHVGLEIGEFIHTLGDAHIYVDHLDAIEEQLSRTPTSTPRLEIAEDFTLDSILPSGTWSLDSASKINLVGYNPHPAIWAKMAV